MLTDNNETTIVAKIDNIPSTKELVINMTIPKEIYGSRDAKEAVLQALEEAYDRI